MLKKNEFLQFYFLENISIQILFKERFFYELKERLLQIYLQEIFKPLLLKERFFHILFRKQFLSKFIKMIFQFKFYLRTSDFPTKY